MSYCRCGDDSDVYVWAGDQYCVTLCAGKEHVSDLMEQHNLEYIADYDTAEEVVEVLLKLKSLGLEIPNRAIERLQNEIEELD